MTAMVEFTLDGRKVAANEGELIVHAAARHGTFIPTLCHDDKLDPYGGCRMCVVDVEGAPRPMPACATRVAEGMVISTNGPITGFQKTLTEMLLSEHLNASPGGRPNELLDMANELGAEAPFILPDAKREEYSDRNQLMGYDPDACILCNRCVRYTQEVMQCSALSLEGRGGDARIVPTWGLSWLDTECELCGGCLSVCPTGAIYEKFEEGTKRPERALEQVRTTCTFCGVGCQIDLNLDPETKHIVKVTSKDEYLPNEGNLCVKGRFAFNFVHHPDRLTQPLVRGEDGELQPTTWEHAIETAATGLKNVIAEHGPQAIGFLVVGPPDERGELPHPEARAHGSRDELRPLVRVDLTRSDSLRPGQVVGQRSDRATPSRRSSARAFSSSSARTRPRPTRCSRCGSRRPSATEGRSSSPTPARSG